MTALLARTAVDGAGVLNVRFLSFCPETCLSGHDNKAVVFFGTGHLSKAAICSAFVTGPGADRRRLAPLQLSVHHEYYKAA